MNICVVGLWHLGSVTAASLAAGGHTVVGLDFDESVIAGLNAGKAPIYEPGLDDLIAACLAEGSLTFTTDPSASSHQHVVWITYDTPVNADDRAEVDFVIRQVGRVFAHLTDRTLVLVSSQLPVGTTARLGQMYREEHSSHVTFGYSPENLRLGKALDVFQRPDRVIVGLRHESDREVVREMLKPFTERIEWMSVESAEMTKHAVNGFLAMSVAFANETAGLCEAVGADAHEVARGLKTESRIGPGSYVSPGGAFAGGTLARDLVFLGELGARYQKSTMLLNAALESNEQHKLWADRRISEGLGPIGGQRIAVWGLTYKPGTDTLRRSSAVELCRRLHAQGAIVHGHDPAVRQDDRELPTFLKVFPDAIAAARETSAVVVATAWPEYRSISASHLASVMQRPWVFDADRFLMSTLGDHPAIRYVTVGAGR